jgi:hypothetical protein
MEFRYQVLPENRTEKIKSFKTRREAEKHKRELEAKGMKSTIWDTKSNSMSNLFKI